MNDSEFILSGLFDFVGGIFSSPLNILIFLFVAYRIARVTKLGKKSYSLKHKSRAVYKDINSKDDQALTKRELYNAHYDDPYLFENADLKVKTKGGSLGKFYNKLKDVKNWPLSLRKILLGLFIYTFPVLVWVGTLTLFEEKNVKSDDAFAALLAMTLAFFALIISIYLNIYVYKKMKSSE